MRTVKVKDLPANPQRGVCLRCPTCGDTWSANRGDYFMAHPEFVMRCENDRAALQLVRNLGECFERIK